jgi:predicted dehydrogenase
MIRVGVLGIGFMGWIHYLAYQRTRGIKFSAFASRDAKKRQGDWRGIQGNFGPPGKKVDVAGVASYATVEELLADPRIDLIDNCLPPHMHADVSILALKAGKHVFCEKPMALTIADCRRMVAAAEKADRQILVGHVLPFFPEYAQARKLIDSGRYGRLLGGNFKRVISDPLWLKDFFDPVRVGGPLIDLHVHDAHLICMLFGTPVSVESQGRMRGEVVEYCHTSFRFPDTSLVVAATSGVINQQGRSFTHGFEIHLERATLQFELAVLANGAAESMPLKVLDNRDRVIYPDLGDSSPISAFEAELKEVARSIRRGTPSLVLAGDLARDAILLCHRQTASVTKGRAVKV